MSRKSESNTVSVESDGGKFRVRWKLKSGKKRSKTFLTRAEADAFAERTRGDLDAGREPGNWIEQLVGDAKDCDAELEQLYRETSDAISAGDWNGVLLASAELILKLGRRGVLMPSAIVDKISTLARSAAPHINFQKHDKQIRALEEKIEEILSARSRRGLKIV